MINQILGHDNIINGLLASVKDRNFVHGYLFSGIEGIGKRMVARLFAAALLCQETNPCYTCSQCIKIASDVHPDVKTVFPDGNSIKINQVRSLIKEMGNKPFEGTNRVFIIDQGEKLTVEASNALLKTLEEPPPYGVIIIITSKENDLLPTIKSRLRKIPFRPLDDELTLEILSDKYPNRVDRINLIKKLGLNSPGLSIKLMDYNELEELVDYAKGLLGSPRDNGYWAIKNMAKLKNEDYPFVLNYMDIILRDILYHHYGITDNNGNEYKNIDNLIEGLTPNDIIKGKELISKAKELLKNNVNPRWAMEYCILKLKGEKDD
jgi:DNA polymerase-3 subunit delta'